jgi:hypothetical protein
MSEVAFSSTRWKAGALCQGSFRRKAIHFL